MTGHGIHIEVHETASTNEKQNSNIEFNCNFKFFPDFNLDIILLRLY